MQFRNLLLLVAVVIVNQELTTAATTSAATTTASPTTPTPATIHQVSHDNKMEIHYTCLKNTDSTYSIKINISNFDNYDRTIITPSDLEKTMKEIKQDTSCEKNMTTVREIKLTNCGDPTGGKPIYLYLSSGNLMQHQVFGGRNYKKFTVDCKLPMSGAPFTAKQKFREAPQSGTSLDKNLEVSLSMEFKSETDQKIDTSLVNIGQMLHMDIIDTSKIGHHYKLMVCTAYSTEQHVHATQHVDIYSSDVPNPDIVGKVIYEPSTTVAITVELNAFRFQSTNDVFIECTVNVCNKQNTAACEQKTSRRRRRSNINTNREEAVKGHFSIRTSPDSVRSAQSKSANLSTKMTVLVAVSVFLKFWMFG
jgi:hypothetical protein